MMNPPCREKPSPTAQSNIVVNPPRRKKPRPSSSLKKPRSSSSIKTKANLARRNRPYHPDFEDYIDELAEIKLAEIKKEFLEAEKNFDTKRDEKFWEDWEISDGFDVDYPALGIEDVPLVIKDVSTSNHFLCDLAYDCARLAIKYENDHKNSNLELLQLVKFNYVYEYGKVFYLTFKAKDREDDRVHVYQSEVLIPGKVVGKDAKERELKTVVRIFRKKPSEYQQSIGGCGKKRRRCRKTKEGCGCNCCDCTFPGIEKKRKKKVGCGCSSCGNGGSSERGKKRRRCGKTKEGCGCSCCDCKFPGIEKKRKTKVGYGCSSCCDGGSRC